MFAERVEFGDRRARVSCGMVFKGVVDFSYFHSEVFDLLGSSKQGGMEMTNFG